MKPEIILYDPLYKQSFIDLNIEWLQKYFVVEPHDQHVFDHVDELIIENEGAIFFVKCDDEIAGTVAMQKISDDVYELAKMAVTEKFKGKGLSNLLMQQCIDFAKEKSLKKIMLVSNRSLTAAISLYKKFGFKEVELETTDYSRANIQMEIEL